MGKGGSNQAPTPQVVNPERPDIPNESNLTAAGIGRTLSAAPYTLSPFRAMDFLHGLPSSPIQVPQFPGNLQAWGGFYNPGYGGGYQYPTNMQMGGMMQHPQQMQYPWFWGGMG